MRNQVLVVQPDREIHALMRSWLEGEGHDVIDAESLTAAAELIGQALPDAIVVHWTSAADFRSLVERLGKRNGSGGGCLLVTAKHTQMATAVAAFDLGADDCIRVPLDRAEFVARLNAGLKRRLGTDRDRLAAGPLVLDKGVHCLYVEDATVNLAPTEFRLLAFFLEHKGRVFSREEILRGAWKRNIHAGSRTVDVHVRRLRQILEPFGCADMIQTVRSFGYRFIERA